MLKSIELNNFELPVFDFGVDEPYDRGIYLQGMLHAHEVLSLPVLYSVVKFLTDNPPNRRVRIVPSCNPGGWKAFIEGGSGRYSPETGQDWNRIFSEANQDETDCYEDELAASLWEISKDFGQVLDVHTPEFGHPHVYTSNLEKRPFTFDDLPFVLSCSTSLPAFEDLHANLRDAASCTLELPSMGVYSCNLVDYWSHRIIEEINVDPAKPPMRTDPELMGAMVNIQSKLEGVVVALAEPNVVCKKNEPIVKVFSPSGETEILTHTKDCLPLCYRRRGSTVKNDWTIRVLELFSK